MNTREEGKNKEEMAERYLKKRGYKVVERNYQKKVGEIDLIVKKDRTLVFVEVRSLKKGHIDPIETINAKKREKIIKTARLFLMEHEEFEGYDVRFDVVGILGNKINHVENAFWEGI